MASRFATGLFGAARSAARTVRIPKLRSARAQTTSAPSRAAPSRYIAVGAAAAIAASATYLGRVRLEDERTKSSEGGRQASGQKMISYAEVQKHTSADDCWVIVDGNVYDVTEFLENHPGGPEIILQNAGTDATRIFKPLHPPDAFDSLPRASHLGPVDPTTVPAPTEHEETAEEKRIKEWREKMPDVGAMLLLDDFEVWAERVLGGTGWNYYRSAADREITMQENADAFKRYFLRPRILRDVTHGSVNTEFMGLETSLPIFISPAAMAKLGHPLGEVNLTKGAGEAGIVQGISINASCSLDEIMEARKEGQKVLFQIYLNKDRSASEKLLQKVTKLGAAGIIFTVDTAWMSKRTRDVRAKSVVQSPIKNTNKDEPSTASSSRSKAPLGVSQAISGYQDSNLTWGDIDFIRKNTPLPIIVKGIQCLEDVQMCVDAGVQGVILSNHGGRQCDYAPAPIDILYEIRSLRPDLFSKIDIMIDGGVRSGADVVKALALGAKAVGLGRPFLYANGTHGQEGVERVCQILHEEIQNTMRNCGVTKVADLKPEMVGPAGPWVGQNRPSWAPKV